VKTPLDWKFHLSMVVAILSVAVPVWLWKADQSSKELSVHVAAQTSLRPSPSVPIPDLKVVVGGQALNEPFVTVLKFHNSGTKPIAAADFESAMLIEGQPQVGVSAAHITDRHPPNLAVSISVANDTCSISPLLLNPGDHFSVALVTANAQPTLRVNARIAGVKSVEVERRVEEVSGKRAAYVKSIVGSALLFAYVCLFVTYREWPRLRLRRRVTLLFGFACAAGGMLLMADALFQGFGLSIWASLAIVLAVMLLGGLFSFLDLDASHSESRPL
jgi:hypothetical protein